MRFMLVVEQDLGAFGMRVFSKQFPQAHSAVVGGSSNSSSDGWLRSRGLHASQGRCRCGRWTFRVTAAPDTAICTSSASALSFGVTMDDPLAADLNLSLDLNLTTTRGPHHVRPILSPSPGLACADGCQSSTSTLTLRSAIVVVVSVIWRCGVTSIPGSPPLIRVSSLSGPTTSGIPPDEQPRFLPFRAPSTQRAFRRTGRDGWSLGSILR